MEQRRCAVAARPETLGHGVKANGRVEDRSPMDRPCSGVVARQHRRELGLRSRLCQYDPQLSHDLSRDVEGFGGHYLMGPILVIARSVACGWAGMVAVAYVAPAAKREASFVFASVLATLVGLGAILVGLRWHAGDISTETAIRFTLDSLPGIIAGFVVAASVPHGSTDDELKRGDWLS
jgi:hypothetical protein